MIAFISTVMGELVSTGDTGRDLLRRMLSGDVMDSILHTVDTLGGYHRTHQQRAKVPTC
jgi:hypothetical protein